MMTTISLSALRKNMASYFNRVSESSETFIIPRNNKDEDAIVILSMQEYKALHETAYLMSTQTNHSRLDESLTPFTIDPPNRFDPGEKNS